MKRITHGRTPQGVVATHHVHGGAASEPCTFSDCPGGLAKRVPFFAGKKYANGRKAATLALAVALWLAGGGVAGAAELYIDANSASGTNHVAGDYPDGATVTVTDDKMTLNINGGTWSDWSSFNAGIKNRPATR